MMELCVKVLSVKGLRVAGGVVDASKLVCVKGGISGVFLVTR